MYSMGMNNMNITTKSGKTFAVDDKCYLIPVTGVMKCIFTNKVMKRMYTIDADDVEVFDEFMSTKRINAITDLVEDGDAQRTTPIPGYV